MKPLPLLLLPLLLAATTGSPPTGDPQALVDEYLERLFATFPSRATAAGRHDLDRRLEDLGPERRADWVEFNRQAAERARRLLAAADLDRDARLDLELVLRRAETEVLDFVRLRRPERDPLFWSGLLSNANVLLLVREDLPPRERLQRAAARARLLPRLAAQAREALAGHEAEIAAEIAALAAGQVEATAAFYREGFPRAADEHEPALRPALEIAGREAAAALAGLAEALRALAARATGSPRLGDIYAERFRLVTGVAEPVERVLARAEADLAAKRREVADYGREVWPRVLAGEAPPAEDGALVARLFERVAADRAATVEEFEADYRDLITRSIELVRRQGLITLPEPLTLRIGRSPGFFIGQSVGGVYPAGPYADPDAETLLFLPMPPDGASEEQRQAFFRDFNHHFNVMITPHEIVPGHYLQLKLAARHPRKVRALLADGVYVEGWGTFCERLMLDRGWGGPLDRLAHLKKQLENIARAVVDIRVHTRGMSRDEVLRYVREEALQDEQFAANMWRRAITSAPQLTFYYLGYGQVMGLYEEVRARRGEGFRLREFMDGMMALGPVPVAHYRESLLGEDGP